MTWLLTTGVGADGYGLTIDRIREGPPTRGTPDAMTTVFLTAPHHPSMNTLPRLAEDAWRLPRHAHVVVYDRRERELLTIYDCGAAQKPPSAQLLGNLVRVHVDHETRRSPTGYTVSLREPGVLRQQGAGHYVVEPEGDGECDRAGEGTPGDGS